MRWLTCASFVLCLAGCHREFVVIPPLTEVEIIEYSKAGKTPEEIVRKIDESRTIYIMDTEDILDLHEQGVDPKVIEHMRRTQERAYARERYYDHYYHYPYRYPYHYPVGVGWGWYCW